MRSVLALAAVLTSTLLLGAPGASASASRHAGASQQGVVVANTANHDAWKRGVIDGYQSVKGKGVTPSIPSAPGTYPSSVRNPAAWYYQQGYKRGVSMARR